MIDRRCAQISINDEHRRFAGSTVRAQDGSAVLLLFAGKNTALPLDERPHQAVDLACFLHMRQMPRLLDNVHRKARGERFGMGD
jgi:hypothetical protein